MVLKLPKIIIADDSRTIRKLIRLEFASESEFTLFDAEDGKQALKLLEDEHPDLITLDLEMPGLDGFETCVKIRSRKDHLATIPIIFITAEDTFEQRLKGYRLGGNDFIVKPFYKGEVISSVKSLLAPPQKNDKTTILVVDDDESILKNLKEYFSSFDINTICLNNKTNISFIYFLYSYFIWSGYP